MSNMMVPQNRAYFPALTICPETGYKRHVLAEHGINKTKEYNNLDTGNMTWWSKTSNISAMELFNEITYSLDEILEEVLIRIAKSAKVIHAIIDIDNGLESMSF